MRRMRVIVTLGSILALAGLLAFAWSYTHQKKKPSTELKFFMPGKYTCKLRQGTYHGWVFNKWRSKDIDEPELLFDNVTIRNSKGIEVGEDISKTLANEVANQINLDGKQGHVDFLLEVPESARYTVQGDENSVIVIAPNKEVHSDATHLIFDGMNDDNNFVSH